MGLVNSCNRNERDFIDKIQSRRASITQSHLTNKSVKPIKEALLLTLSSSFPMDLHDSTEYRTLKKLLFNTQNKEIISTFSFI